ncbi:hypothetical protein OLMES_4188 [Oleiphilus messinensis]|uniref:Methyl-accepting chemotaxis protein n=1 Tax=Oleiphilus messinensis TaxID=141451 RepID=A0A1Y0IFQ4_9GAMM|nr:DUF4391 domain-containing protein [Oleiphilus messinensis]ARU58204.1 hypothetical protein OLMES_4188 [Oleiphilus messinensis]
MPSSMPCNKAECAKLLLPESAQFGKKLPKEKIYQYASPSHAIKQKFVRLVDRIVWQFKLSPETINIPATKSVPEIQIFDLYLKPNRPLKSGAYQSNSDDLMVDEAILRTIDKAIPFPIFYCIQDDEGKQQYAMAYKRPHEADSSQWVVEDYFYCPVREEESAEKLPAKTNLNGLYEHLLRRLISEPAKSGESLKDQIHRITAIRTKQKELQKLENKLHKEKQFNRKVEINQLVNHAKEELAALSTKS